MLLSWHVHGNTHPNPQIFLLGRSLTSLSANWQNSDIMCKHVFEKDIPLNNWIDWKRHSRHGGFTKNLILNIQLALEAYLKNAWLLIFMFYYSTTCVEQILYQALLNYYKHRMIQTLLCLRLLFEHLGSSWQTLRTKR